MLFFLAQIYGSSLENFQKKRVILVLGDGLNVGVLDRLIQEGQVPTIAHLQKTGLWTLDAKTSGKSETTYCISTMMYGMPVEALPERLTDHYFNLQEGTVLPHYLDIHNACQKDNQTKKCLPFPQYPNIYQAIAPHKGAFVGNWPEFEFLVDAKTISLSSMKAPPQDLNNMDDGVTQRALEVLNNPDIDFAFIYYEQPDQTGHTDGFGPTYEQAIKDFDTQLSIIAQHLRPEDYLIVVSDHGREIKDGKEHSAYEHDTVTIPLFITGPSVPTGAQMSGFTSISDVFATICDIFEKPLPADTRTQSILSHQRLTMR